MARAPLTCPSCGRAVTITEQEGQEPVTEHAEPLCRAARAYRRRQVLVVRRSKAPTPPSAFRPRQVERPRQPRSPLQLPQGRRP